jgi:hypothetical protein
MSASAEAWFQFFKYRLEPDPRILDPTQALFINENPVE